MRETYLFTCPVSSRETISCENNMRMIYYH